jgi:hypothetical protein
MSMNNNHTGAAAQQIQNNTEFLEGIFGSETSRSLVISFPDINKKGGSWVAYPANKRILPPNSNNYFCVSLFKGNQRQVPFFESMHVFVFDDVGTKLSETFMDLIMPPPSYVIETSPGNKQWGYVFDTPLTDPRIYSALLSAIIKNTSLNPSGKDPGMGGVNRVMRLPFGVNNKACYQEKTKQPFFPHVIHSMDLGRKHSVAEIARLLGADISEEGLSFIKTMDYAQITDEDAANDPVMQVLQEQGMIMDAKRNEQGFYKIHCPWEEEHTPGQPGTTTGAAYKPGNGFKCHHGHTPEKGYGDILHWALEFMSEEQHAAVTGLDTLSDLPPLPTAHEKMMAHYDRLRPTVAADNDPAQIPPRAFLYGKHYIRKFVSATIATGGVGKSSLVLGEAMAMATGRNLLTHHGPIEPLRVWWWCGEDPHEELDRRRHAVQKAYLIDHPELGNRFFFDSGRKEKKIKIASIVNNTFVIDTDLVDAIVRQIIDNQFDVMIVDPFVSSHSCPENDNNSIDAVVKIWADIADRTNCAIELVHHVRKTAGGDISADDARGASSLKDACRDVRVLNRMSAAEAASARINRRGVYFRIDSELGKQNMQPPAEGAEWYRLRSINLGNGTEKYPDGDSVGAVAHWTYSAQAAEPVKMDVVMAVQKAIPQDGAGESPNAKPYILDIIGSVIGAPVRGRSANDLVGKKKAEDVLADMLARGYLRREQRAAQRRGSTKSVYVVGETAFGEA